MDDQPLEKELPRFVREQFEQDIPLAFVPSVPDDSAHDDEGVVRPVTFYLKVPYGLTRNPDAPLDRWVFLFDWSYLTCERGGLLAAALSVYTGEVPFAAHHLIDVLDTEARQEETADALTVLEEVRVVVVTPNLRPVYVTWIKNPKEVREVLFEYFQAVRTAARRARSAQKDDWLVLCRTYQTVQVEASSDEEDSRIFLDNLRAEYDKKNGGSTGSAAAL